MENDRLRPEEIEREDIRTFPRSLRRFIFNRKSEFYKNIKDEMEKNLALKKALCEKAEALKDSTDWKSTTEKMIALQKNGRRSDR